MIKHQARVTLALFTLYMNDYKRQIMHSDPLEKSLGLLSKTSLIILHDQIITKRPNVKNGVVK